MKAMAEKRKTETEDGRPLRHDLGDIEAAKKERQDTLLPEGREANTLPDMPSTFADSDKDVKVDAVATTLVRKPYGSEPRNIDVKTGQPIDPEPVSRTEPKPKAKAEGKEGEGKAA
jgi:hypothetical protein